VSFVRADQWIGHWEQHDPQAALVELCRRYIATYGPTTHQDIAHWFRLKPEQARVLMVSLAADLEEVEFIGRRAWLLASAARDDPQEADESSLWLLPQYDCYLLGCGPRERIVPEVARPRVNSYGRGRFESATGLPVLLIDGAVAGMWERRRRGKTNELRVESFVELTARQHEQLEAEAARIGAFLGVNMALSLGILGA
jgi:uncharacterized protein YcaQ